MPWKPDGTFERTNEEFNGFKVWQDDRDALIKIIAERHDYHDQDLATGIEQCLNINGLNQLLGNLNMGNNKIENLGSPVTNTDAAPLGYTFGSIDLSGTTLTVRNRLGALLDTTQIPAGLPDAPADSKTYGRNNNNWVEVSAPAGYQSDLRATQSPSQVQVLDDNTAGSVATILPVSDTYSGVMTPTQSSQLANLVAAGTGGGMIPPIEIIGVNPTPQDGLQSIISGWTAQSGASVRQTWIDLLSITGSGLVEFLGAVQSSLTGTGIIDLRLYIDEADNPATVWNADSVFNDTLATPTPDGCGICIIGVVDTSTGDLQNLQQIKFNKNIRLQAKSNQANASTINAHIKWQKYS